MTAPISDEELRELERHEGTMTWPVEDVPGVGPSFILKGRGSDHVPRPTPASRLAERRANARAKGICIVCTRRPAKDGCTSCIECLDARADRAERGNKRRARATASNTKEGRR